MMSKSTLAGLKTIAWAVVIVLIVFVMYGNKKNAEKTASSKATPITQDINVRHLDQKTGPSDN